MERTSINLGRCHSKYLIVEVLSYAATVDAQKEGESLLWSCSRRHRNFLSLNFNWYPKCLKYKAIVASLMKQSQML